MSYEGVFEFYCSRIDSAPKYGFKAGHELINIIMRTAYWDSFLTMAEYKTIINLCEEAHIKMMEDNYNAGWKQ